MILKVALLFPLFFAVVLSNLVINDRAKRAAKSKFSARKADVADRGNDWFGDFGNSFDLDTIGNDFGSLFRRDKWWTGPNVCKREENHIEAQGGNEFLFDLTENSCSGTSYSYKCTNKKAVNGTVFVRTVTYECCHGYERDGYTTGCQTRLNLSPIPDTLEQLNFTKFLAALDKTGIKDRLTTDNFTIFAPTDTAMENSEKDTFDSVVVAASADRLKYIREVVQSHIVSGFYPSNDFDDEETLPTIKEGSNLRINFFSIPGRFYPIVTANCARVTRVNDKADNGIIHTVDRVLTPATQTLAEIIQTHPKLSSFKSILNADQLARLNNGSLHDTVLAFTDEAFSSLSDSVKNKITSKDKCYAELFDQHLIFNTICTAAIQYDSAVRNSLGHLLQLYRTDDNSVHINNATVVVADLMATNGVVQIIDQVLISDEMSDGMTVVDKNPKTSLFAGLLRSAGIDQQLQQLQNFTIFAPTDDAIREADLPTDNNAALKSLLLNHIGNSVAPIGGFGLCQSEMDITTLAGANLTVVQNSIGLCGFMGSARVQCANILEANTEVCGGVIHLINKVLSNPNGTVMDQLRANRNFSKFLQLVEAAGMSRNLSSMDFDGTLLTPDDSALSSSTDIDQILSNPAEVVKFVKMHILPERHCCNEFGGGNRWFQPSYTRVYRNLAGSRLGLGRFGSGRRSIGSATIRQCDIQAKNGIIQVVDRPVKPLQRRSVWADLDEFLDANFNDFN